MISNLSHIGIKGPNPNFIVPPGSMTEHELC